MRPGARHSPEARARISAATRAAMQNPEIRRRISDRTREGMKNAPSVAMELRVLLSAWNNARETVRARFLAVILSPVPERDAFTKSQRAAVLSPIGCGEKPAAARAPKLDGSV